MPSQKNTSPKFTHLHVHSHYSLLDGLSKIDELLDHVKENGMDAVALTDHGNMYGAVEFYKKAKNKNIKPIIGMETYVASGDMRDKRPNVDDKRFHLTLLAKNNIGYKNLIKLNSKAHIEGFYYKPRVDKDCLREHAQGLIALSGCLAAEVPRAIQAGNLKKAKEKILEYQNIFGKENYFLEVQHHGNIPDQKKVNEALFKFSKELDIPLVATQDSHYTKKDDAEAHDVLLAIQTGNQVDDDGRLSLKDDDFSIRPPQEMAKYFADRPEAIENTQRITEMCNVELDMGDYQLPVFEVPEGHDSDSYLEELCEKGLTERYGNNISGQIKERLNYELSIIKKTGFSSYMLIVADFVNWAKSKEIVVGPGRGSAAGSLVCYLLGITNVDPIKFNLLFERFLNPERISMPDIDLDFADTRRDEVLKYVAEKYGEDKVAQIITFGTMAARAAVRDAGRAMGYSYDYCDKVAKLIPMNTKLDESLQEVEDFRSLYNNDPEAKKLVDAAKRLEGVVRHASVHACGVVITKDELTNHVPLQKSPQSRDSTITQYEMHAVEDLGLLKMDFLGLKNLSIIEAALAEIERRHNKKIDLDNIPLNDKKTYQMLQKADTTGVFQLESEGMRRYLKDLRPTNIEDIIAMVALYRPGPMELIPDFIARKHGKKPITYVHPKLEPILKNTYGIAVYQEQVLQIARELGGFTYGEADVLRKAIGKKIKKLLDEQEEKWMTGLTKNGIDKPTAEKLWEFVKPFARYGFNRAHAASYARIAHETAYLKAHYPVEFFAALLNAEQKNIDRLAFLLEEAKNHDIEILPPSINESMDSFTVVDATENKGVIRFGLAAIKNVGSNVVAEIIKERERNGNFQSIEELLKRVVSRDFNKKSIEALIKSGGMDELGERNTLLENIDNLLQYSKEHQSAADAGQFSLFAGGEQPESANNITLKQAKAAPKHQQLMWEKELLGFYITSHPLEEYKKKLTGLANIKSLASAANSYTQVKIGAIINNTKKIITKKGQPMMFVGLEDLSGKVEALVFPSLFEKRNHILEENKLVVVEGKVNTKDGELKLLCDDIKELK